MRLLGQGAHALTIPHIPMMTFGDYARHVISPTLGIECVGDTLPVKVCTADLRVVFNGESAHRRLGELLGRTDELVARPPDPVEYRGLVGNARC